MLLNDILQLVVLLDNYTTNVPMHNINVQNYHSFWSYDKNCYV